MQPSEQEQHRVPNWRRPVSQGSKICCSYNKAVMDSQHTSPSYIEASVVSTYCTTDGSYWVNVSSLSILTLFHISSRTLIAPHQVSSI